jgi:hypothetical protein
MKALSGERRKATLSLNPASGSAETGCRAGGDASTTGGASGAAAGGISAGGGAGG